MAVHCFYRFVKDVRAEIPYEHVPGLLDSIRDLLRIEVQLLQEETIDIDALEEDPEIFGIFDSQLYLFETVGTLLSLLGSAPTEQAALLEVRLIYNVSDVAYAIYH